MINSFFVSQTEHQAHARQAVSGRVEAIANSVGLLKDQPTITISRSPECLS